MHTGNAVSFEHWVFIAIFFLIFAICGFNQKPGKRACGPCHYIALGILTIGINAFLLAAASNIGYHDFDLLYLLTLKEISIESSFIVLGYCLMIQGSTFLIKSLLYPAKRKTFI